MDPEMNRAVLTLFFLCLPMAGTTVRAIPPPPPDDVRIVKVIDGNTIVVTPYGDPFKGCGSPASILPNFTRAPMDWRPRQRWRACSNPGPGSRWQLAVRPPMV
jgi:hypothetical protein